MPISEADARAWCNQARALLALPKGKTRDLIAKVSDAERLVAAGKPAEMSDPEWATVTDALATAKGGMPARKELESAQRMNARGQNDPGFGINKAPLLEGLTGALDGTAKKITARKLAMEGLLALEQPADTVKIGTLEARGQARLAQLDDPAAAFAKVKAYFTRCDAAEGALAGLADYLDLAAAQAIATDCRRETKELDLGDALDDLDTLEEIVRDAKAEQAKVATLKVDLASAGEQPATEADWKLLYEKTTEFEEIKKTGLNAALDYARKTKGKEPQLQAFETKLIDAVAAWPALSLQARLGAGYQPGELAWIVERVKRLQEPPADGPEAKKQKADAAEWDKLLVDIDTKWGLFVASGYNKALRGVDIPGAVKTDYVRARTATIRTLKVGGRTYVKSSSDSGGVSLKTGFPAPPGGYERNADGKLMVSFIYHL